MMRWMLGVLLAVLLAGGAAATDLKEWSRGRPQERVPVVRPDSETMSDLEPGLRERAADLAQRNHEIHALLGPQHVSRLARERLAAKGLGPGRDLGAKTQGVETLRVLIVRIGFETDRSGDLTSITTDGDFQLQPDPSVRVDPPPHNRDFYMSHLYGLSEYYHVQSGGRLRIQGRVLPEGQNDCYKLSDIADYGPGEDGGWTVPMLETLVRDMLVAADEGTQADGDVSLADFDDDDPLTYVILVHAGADWQTDVNRDSPNDIPTFFVALGEPQALTSVDTETGEPGAISECSIIPETTSQDGYLGSIAGALYHEFGHALGLPDVYNTRTGLPAAGLWDLMDSGPNLVSAVGFPDPDAPGGDPIVVEAAGLLPPSLSAWCRWYLGWLDVEVADGQEHEIHLPAAQVPRSDYDRWYAGSSWAGDPFDFDRSDPQAVIAGASPREFVLLENRWVPLTASELPDTTIGPVRDPATGVFLYMAGDWALEEGRYRNTGMYDFFMPGGGLLAWHVNQDKILAGMPDNTINADGEGLRLIEADGIQDVGVLNSYVIGFYGTELDPFHSGSTATLPQEGRPSTLAYDRAWTGAEISSISAATATMSFDAVVRPLTPGAPWRLPRPATTEAPRRLSAESLTPFVLDDKPVLLAASELAAEDPDGGAWLFAWNVDGTPAVTAPDGAPTGAALVLEEGLAGAPLVIDGPAGAGPRLVLADHGGTVRALGDVTDGGVWLPVWETVIGDSLAFAPAALPGADGDLLFCPRVPSEIITLDPLGQPVGTVVGLPRSSGMQATALTAVGERTAWIGDDAVHLLDAVETDLPLPASIRDHVGAAVSLRIPEGQRLIVVGAGGEAFVVDVVGAAVDPGVASSLDLGSGPVRAAAAADLDADGADDLIVVTASRLYAFSRDLIPLTGWPLELLDRFPLDADTEFAGGLVVFDGDGDGVNEVWATTTGGHLIAFDARGTRIDRTPLLWADRGAGRAVVGDAGELGRVLWLADPGGRETVPLGGGESTGLSRTAVDGGVAGYLTLAAAGKAAGTSEWLGVGGGPRRRGAVGEAAAVDGAASADEAGRLVVHPNPARGQEARFRFRAEADGAARVTVFNLEGEIVATLDGEAVDGMISELVLPLDGLASGVYLCRLSAPTADGTSTRMERLAVER